MKQGDLSPPGIDLGITCSSQQSFSVSYISNLFESDVMAFIRESICFRVLFFPSA